MLNLLYEDNIAIDDQTLFYDLDMGRTLPISKVKDVARDYIILFGDLSAKNNDALDNDLSHTLAICDKLALRNIINKILTLDGTSIPYTSLIINHSLSNYTLIELYAKTCTYNLLYGYIHYYKKNSINHNHEIFRNATRNGLRVTNLSVYDEFTNDYHIRCCTFLTTLKFYDIHCKITSCEPFAKTLKVLHVMELRNFGDKQLEMCTSIVELDANNNRKITTCAPFANSLEVLDAAYSCGIGNDGLASCHFKKLTASNNRKITTCEPFAKTLKILHAGNECGIADIGIASCNNIVELNASNNSKITTCVPFAKTLKMLYAGNECGIADIGIASCNNIKVLSASNNSKITTCAPFAKSLRRLYALGLCGITDNGIASCHYLEYLYASCNPTITTCAPFAKSLKCLYAAHDNSGMNTDGVLLCKSLITLYTDFNNKVDRSKITMVKKLVGRC